MRQSGVHSKYSAAEKAEVSFVRFSTFGREQLENWSVAEINETRLYEGNKPFRGSPNDLRLGVSTLDQKCETCGQSRECQGHFGHIKLNEPVFHFGFMHFVEQVLKCVCLSCSKLRLVQNPQQKEKLHTVIRISQSVRKLNEFSKLLGTVSQCVIVEGDQPNDSKSGCGANIPTKISLKNHQIIVKHGPKNNGDKDDDKRKSSIYTAQMVYNILRNIKSADAKLLGFTVSRPEDLMIRTLAVAPPQIRPSIEMNPEKHAEDDITSAYVRIISINNQLKGSLETSQKEQKIREMERIIASIMVKVQRQNIDRPSLNNKRKRATKPIKSIEQRLKSKEGRFRQHLMGKRVDFSARSVVSPDSNLALDELGVPEKIARALTIPEQITEWNYDRIVKLCAEGKVKYLLKPSEDKKVYQNVINFVKINDKPSQIEKYLSYGMVVERCLENGDYVLFNRQPTLHRMSMMGHRVRILPFNTFRLNLSVCTPYNADFDGDQMNMHVPQSYETIAQIKHITHVPKQIVAPKNNAPVIGIVQDALLGVYLFTMRDTFLTREQVMNLVIWIEQRFSTDHLQPGQLPMPAILKPEPLWTGKQIMSLIIPDKISIQISKSGDIFRNINDNSMMIRKGQLISGALQKEVVGSGPGGLVHSIWIEISPEATNEFVTTAQRIVNSWMTTNSFTLGAADVVPDAQLERTIVDQCERTVKFYFDTLNKYRNEKKIETENLHQRGKKIMDSFDFNVNASLNSRLDSMAKITTANVSPYLNNIYKIITAKSKGNQTNLMQIMFCLGNQNVDGKRLPLGFSRRSLPHFSKDDNSPESRGFVFSSFYKGLKPHQFFFHSMGGREGLSDTAVKTSRTGYIQRKLVKSLQDLVVKYDGTVRDSQNNMLQKLYGEDSFCAEYIEKHKIGDVSLSEEAFRRKYEWSKRILEDRFGCDEQKIKKTQEQIESLLRCRNRLREIFVIKRDTPDVQYHCPINIGRLIRKIQATGGKQKSAQIVNPAYVFQNTEKTLSECLLPQSAAEYRDLISSYSLTETEGKKSELNRKKREFEQEQGLELFRIHIRMFLASRIICDRYGLSERHFNGLLEEIKMKFSQSLAPAGEAIGSIAAQSIGQPTTQMTLNTFHLAGVADKNVTLGVPRLQQLLDASKNIRTPNSTIFLKQKISFADRTKPEIQKQLGAFISFYFPERHVRDFLAASKIYYDPNAEKSNIGAKTKELVLERRLPWVISLQFNPKKLTSKESWNQILHKIEAKYQDCFEITQKVGFMENKEGTSEITMRCHENFIAKLKEKGKNFEEDRIFQHLNEKELEVKEIFISGIKNIKTVKLCGKLILEPSSEDAIPEAKQANQYNYVVFETDGSNLRACLSHPKIDECKTYCNDITEIFNVLGIEAARQSFINQFKDILKPYSIYVNYRHLSILADWMSTRGVLTAINRNGINRVRDVSILRKASFEETTDVLFSAAVFAEIDELKGVSQRIIFGESVRIGTRSFDVMIDRDIVQNYNAKGKKDREQEAEDKEDPINAFNSQKDGWKTPAPYETPHARNSIHAMKSPSIYMIGGLSPGFQTPCYKYSPRQFSEHENEVPSMSPMPSFGRQSYATPIISSNSPLYGSMHQPIRSNQRSPSYMNFQASNSPNYSSAMRSQSPNYEGSGRVNSSPNYTPTPIGSNREFKEEEEVEDEEDDE